MLVQPTTLLLTLLPLLASAQEETPAFETSALAPRPTDAPVVSIFFPGNEGPANIDASIRAVSAGTTTLQIQCAAGTDGNDCGLGPGLDITVVSSKTYIASMVDPGSFTINVNCVPNTSASVATCVTSAGGPDANFPGVETTTYTGDEVAGGWVRATVTAGAKLLSEQPAKTTGSAEPTSTAEGSRTSASKDVNASGTGAAPQETGAAGRIGPGGLMAGLGAVGAVAAFF